jgi:hypothetical protein
MTQSKRRRQNRIEADSRRDAKLLGVLSLEDWEVVIAADARWKLLDVAEKERTWPAVLRFVEELKRTTEKRKIETQNGAFLGPRLVKS